MATPSITKVVAIALIVLAIAVPLALQWGFTKYEKQEVSGKVVAIVKDTTVRCREALTVGPAALKTEPGEARVRDHLATIERYAIEVRSVQLAPERNAFGQAATDYVLTCREILLRQNASHAAYAPLMESMQALRNHMRGNTRAPGWPQGAVRAKTRVDDAYRDYRIATDAYLSLLESFAASHSKIAAQVNRADMIDEAFLKEAHAKATQVSTQTGNEVKKLTRLDSYR